MTHYLLNSIALEKWQFESVNIVHHYLTQPEEKYGYKSQCRKSK